MAFATADELKGATLFDGDSRHYGNQSYENYVPPNLAPRPADWPEMEPRPLSWRQLPPPPPDPIVDLLRWSIRRPGLALILLYLAWLGFWAFYALQSL